MHLVSSKTARKNIKQLMHTYGERDSVGLVEALEKMSRQMGGTANYFREKLESEVEKIFKEGDSHPFSLSDRITDIFRAASRNGLLIGLGYLQLLKALATFEATMKETEQPSKSLDPEQF